MGEDRIAVESPGLPPAELERLLVAGGVRAPGLSYDLAPGSGRRGDDPTIAVAVVSGVVSLLVPFMTKLAERLFAAEPGATLTVWGAPGGDTVVLRAEVPAADAADLVAKAVAAGARDVRISIGDPPV